MSRELGRPCVVGCGSNTVTTLAGQRVTLDGASGRIWAGDLAVEPTDEASIAELRKLIDWGAPLIPLLILREEAAPADSVDLDAHGAHWRAALKPGITVRGRVLETGQGIRAAMAAGVRAAAVRYRLPALLACLQPAPAQANAKSSGDVAPVTSATGIAELSLLQLLALKGRATPDILADALSLSADAAAATYVPLCQRGLCTNVDKALRLTQTGQGRLRALLAEERARADPGAVVAVYEDFCVFNAELKQIMTAWQVKGNGSANDHLDANYDSAVLQRLADLHVRSDPLIRRLTQFSQRLAIYPVRLSKAHARIAAGDHSYVAKIILDSYHTVWFELHKELISLAGLNQETEARAGRAM